MEHAPTFTKWFRPERVQLPTLNSTEADSLEYDVPFSQYLTDRTCVSNSGLRKVLKSPRHYIADLLGYEDDEEPEKDHFRFGRAAHLMVLEPSKFARLHLVMPKFVGLTKDGRESDRSKEALEAKKKWLDEVDPDALVITQDEMDVLLNMVDSLMSHDIAAGLLKNGRAEVTGKFLHKPTGIRVRIRPDYFTFDKHDRLYISDLKTARDVDAGLFATSAARYRYVMQLALYLDGIKQITGRDVEAAALIALEKKPPYECYLYWLNDDDLEKGRQQYTHALEILRKCIDTGKWPSRQTSGQMLQLPAWTEFDELPQFDFGT